MRVPSLLFAIAAPASSLSSFLESSSSSRYPLRTSSRLDASATVDCPRSNATHVVWMRHAGASSERELSDENDCIFMTREEAEKGCMKALREDLMAFDEPFAQTMGFSDGERLGDDFGLDSGMIGPTITLGLDAKVHYPWTDRLPKYIWYNYVLNYANMNEARSNWRPLFKDALNLTLSRTNEEGLRERGDFSALLPELNGTNTIISLSSSSDTEAVHTLVAWVNRVIWTRLARHPDRPIKFVSSQTPLIFDPMSVVAFGYASCTGTSILFVNALRAVGVPARVVGTPAWYGNATANGNHNWVEVWDFENGWKFLEPSPALPHVDTLDDSPCQRWFCHPSSRYPASRVYAPRLGRIREIEYCEKDDLERFEGGCEVVPVPLPWQWDCQDVPGFERTQYYVDACQQCDEQEG